MAAVDAAVRRYARAGNINFGLNWTRNNTETVGAFPSLAGNTDTQGLQATSGWTYGNGRRTNILRFTYNHNHVGTSNLYSNAVDVAGLAGIQGVSTDPFDFGLPGISFTQFGGLSNPIARRELDQTYTISDTVAWYRGKHNLRFGGDYRRILQSFRSAKNAEGSFIFSGLETSEFLPGSSQPVTDTGFDFADFLLGVPQQTSLQSGTNSYNFSANSLDAFFQDDWRIFSKLSLNLGVRYEYIGPYTEANNRIANLDVAPGFTAAAPVLPGQTGAFNGAYPAALFHVDHNDWAPRIGVVWRPLKQTGVLATVNYNLAQYGNIIQNFAFQPPFATTSTNVTSAAVPLTLTNGFPPIVPGSVTNNFAVDPNYKLGHVQVWNLDIQRTLPHGFLLNLDYNGSKGTRLDEYRAIEIPGIQPFLYESSAADSIFHAGSVRVRKRMAHGIGFQASYIFSKSIDDASSIGAACSRGAESLRHRRRSRPLQFRPAPQIYRQLDVRSALWRKSPLCAARGVVAHPGQLAIERRLHRRLGAAIYTQRAGQQRGPQPRRHRLASRRCHRPAYFTPESQHCRVVQHRRVLLPLDQLRHHQYLRQSQRRLLRRCRPPHHRRPWRGRRGHVVEQELHDQRIARSRTAIPGRQRL